MFRRSAISWYSMYPNHYGGDASGATAARGQASTKEAAERIAAHVRHTPTEHSPALSALGPPCAP